MHVEPVLTANQQLVFKALGVAEAPLSACATLERLQGRGVEAPLQVYRAQWTTGYAFRPKRVTVEIRVTVVDAKHMLGEIETAPEVLEQLAFADVVVINKTDLVNLGELAAVEARIRKINPMAAIEHAERCDLPLDRVLGRDAFNLKRVLEVEPDFLTEDHAHDHDEEIGSLSLVSDREVDERMFSTWIRQVTQTFGTDILRLKGIIAFKNDPERFVVQGVHMLLEGDYQRPWKADEQRQSRLVFIGRDLPEQVLRDGFAQCQA